MANSTWNPADRLNITLSGGNLLATQSATPTGVRSTDFQTTGKFYWEYTITSMGQTSTALGIANSSAVLSTANGGVNGCIVTFTGNVFVNAAAPSPTVNIGTLPAAAHGVVCCALDMTAKRFWLRATGTGQWNNGGSDNPATGVNGIDISSITSTGIYALFAASAGSGEATTANFGDSAFVGAVPAGFTSGFPAGGGAATAQARAMVLA